MYGEPKKKKQNPSFLYQLSIQHAEHSRGANVGVGVMCGPCSRIYYLDTVKLNE